MKENEKNLNDVKSLTPATIEVAKDSTTNVTNEEPMSIDDLTRLGNHYADETDPVVTDILATEETAENTISSFIIPGEVFSEVEISAIEEGDYDWLLKCREEKFTKPETIMYMLNFLQDNNISFDLIYFIETFQEYFDEALIGKVAKEMYQLLKSGYPSNNIDYRILTRGLQYLDSIEDVALSIWVYEIENHNKVLMNALMVRFGLNEFKAFLKAKKKQLQQEFETIRNNRDNDCAVYGEEYSENDLFNDTWAWLETIMLEMRYEEDDVYNKLKHCSFRHFITKSFEIRKLCVIDRATASWITKLKKEHSNSDMVDKILASKASNIRKLYMLSRLDWERIDFDNYKLALQRLNTFTLAEKRACIREVTTEVNPYNNWDEKFYECMEHLMFIILCGLPEEYWNKEEFYETITKWFRSKQLPFCQYAYAVKGLGKNPEFIAKHSNYFDSYIYIMANSVEWDAVIFKHMIKLYPEIMNDLTYIMNDGETIYQFVMEEYSKAPVEFMESIKKLNTDVYDNLNIYTCYEDNYLEEESIEVNSAEDT